MKSILIVTVPCVLGLTGITFAKDLDYTPDAEFIAIKDAVTRTRAALRQFCWNAHTVVTCNGQVRKVSDDLCRYGPDGTVYRTPLATPSSQSGTRGLRKRSNEVTLNNLEQSITDVIALAQDYVPPSPQKLEALFQAANALFVRRAGSERTRLQFRDYLKPGDSLVLSFDPETKSLRAIDVGSYLTDESDIVTLHVDFQSLSDGTTYAASSVLNATGRQIQVKTENLDYRKLLQ